MQLEDYFEFESFDTPYGRVERIRIKGHRISIEHVLEHYKAGTNPETIVHDIYPTLNLEKVHATITYYLHNKDRVEEYIRQGEAIAEAYYQEHLKREPSEAAKRLRALKAQKQQEAASPLPLAEAKPPVALP